MKSRHLFSSLATLFCVANLLAAQDPPPPDTTPADKPRRERIVTDLSGFDLLDTLSLQRQTMVAGATRGRSRPVALAPRLGKIYAARPAFSWRQEGTSKTFVFRIWDDAGEDVHRTEVSGTRFRYPAGATALEPGEAYVWSVAAGGTLLGESPSVPVGILVASPEQRETIRSELEGVETDDPYTEGLARAHIFTRHRLWYDAIEEYTDLIANYPERAELYEGRGMIYAQLEVTQALADADFARADELEGRGG